jgi:3-oxoacyl-(acyl-carrier-protein) synthase
MMMKRRVKITGLGPVTPAGVGRAAFASGINEAVSRVRAVTLFTPPSNAPAGGFIAAEVPELNLPEELRIAMKENSKRATRAATFGVFGAYLALQDAGLTFADLRRLNPVVVNGSSLMDVSMWRRTFEQVLQHGPKGAQITVITESPPIAIAGHIAGMIDGPCRTLSLQTACCSGLDAIAQGYEMVATGQAEIAVCCGSESPVTYQPLLELGRAGLSPLNAADPASMSRPFDLWRTTGVIGEGAAVVVLESADSPRRGYAWITGYAYAADYQTSGAHSGLSDCMVMALANANRDRSEVDFVNAWGPGHPATDRIEAQCLRELFGPRLAQIPVVSIKGAIGNPLGAAGAIQVASTALTLRDGTIPPTVNYEYPDPDCPLNLSPAVRRIRPNVALVNAHGLSGSNACIVMERCSP